MEAKKIREQLAQICWYMRGSISWAEAWDLSSYDRKLLTKLIEDNIERTKKSKMPLI